MSEETVSVVHLLNPDDNALLSTQRQVVQELSAGRDVLVVCEDEHVKRLERISLASLPFRGLRGRIAVVARNAESFKDMIPPAMTTHLHVFASQEEAMKWLRPGPDILKETIRYFELSGIRSRTRVSSGALARVPEQRVACSGLHQAPTISDKAMELRRSP